MRVILAVLISILLLSPSALAQGLLGIGKHAGDVEDFDGLDGRIPLNFWLSGGVGWDSNSNTGPSGGDSAFIFGGIGAEYGTGNQSTQVSAGLEASNSHYFEDIPGLDSDFQMVRLTLDMVHRAKPRLTISNDTLFSYEIEPDYEIGASTSRRSDQYLYIYNRIAAAYQWRPRTSTVMSYAIGGIMYDSGPIARVEDRYTHLISEQVRYQMSQRTTLTSEYRYQHTEFGGLSREISSHFILFGADHRLSETTTGTMSVGAEIYDDSTSGGETKPYAEGALIFQVTEDTNLRWANRLGFETNELFGFGNRYGYRTGISAQHDITPLLQLVSGLSYFHSKFEGLGALADVDEEAVNLNVALKYRVSPGTTLNAGYQFTNYVSDIAIRSFEQHRVSIGVSVNF